MVDKRSAGLSVKTISSAISQVLGSAPVLPGESEAVYNQGLAETVQELGATTPLQIHIAVKIYECMWWMRRYENQKRATVIHSMSSVLDPDSYSKRVTKIQAWAMDALHANRIDDEFKDLLDENNLTMETLTQQAMASCRGQLESIDQMIAVNAKNLAGFQASYEVLINRQVNAERMRLQNALMQRDLGAIDSEPKNGDNDD
jgi:hypothetical protein